MSYYKEKRDKKLKRIQKTWDASKNSNIELNSHWIFLLEDGIIIHTATRCFSSERGGKYGIPFPLREKKPWRLYPIDINPYDRCPTCGVKISEKVLEQATFYYNLFKL